MQPAGNPNAFPSGSAEDNLAEVVGLMLDFLVSKSLVASERTLRNELQLLISSAESAGSGQAAARWKRTVRAQNVYTSELERRLRMEVPLSSDGRSSPAVVDVTPTMAVTSKQDEEVGARLPHQSTSTNDTSTRVQLFEMQPVAPEEEGRLRQRRGTGTPQQRVVFHDPVEMPTEQAETLAHISLPLLFNPHVNGLEDQAELTLPVGAVIAGRYRVAANIGKGSFSKVFQVRERREKRPHRASPPHISPILFPYPLTFARTLPLLPCF